MPRAIWNGAVVAEARDDQVEIVENNVYFPWSSVHQEFFQNSATETRCAWKGLANYYSLIVDGNVNHDAAWIYRAPLEASKQIANHVAFWKGVDVER